MNSRGRKLNCFISYSHRDAKMLSVFQAHLDSISRLYNIECWYDGKIPAGGSIDKEVIDNLKKADIILLLISPHYLSSYYCYENELKEAMRRHNRNECAVIPVILREFVRDNYPFSGLKYVPTDGRPIDSFNPRNNGYVSAATGIRNLIQQFNEKTSPASNNSKTKKVPTSLKKKATQKASDNSKSRPNKDNIIYYDLVKNGEVKRTVLKQKTFDSITVFFQEMPKFMADADFLLKNQINNFKNQINKKVTMSTLMTRGKDDIDCYLAQLFTYIQKHFVGVNDTYVHFRIKQKDKYCTISKFGYPINGLKTEPISAYNSMIGRSVELDMPVISSYNKKLHTSTHPGENVDRDYITFTFGTISRYFNVDISMCISAIGKSKALCKNVFPAMAVSRFDRVVEDYVIKYIDSCKKLHPDYNISGILNFGG